MDSEFLGSLSDGEKGEVEKALASPTPYTDMFEKQCSRYVAAGMTPDQFWNGDSTDAKYYREAKEIQDKKQNEWLWLQGMYVYDAMARLAPLFNSNAKKGTKAKPYTDEPYPITDGDKEEAKKRKEHTNLERGLAYMNNYIANAKKGGG